MTRSNVESKEINILLLGETGSGKSTTLNSLANYRKFATFEEANSAEQIVEIIPTQFSIKDQHTGKERILRSGPSDSNEQHEAGSSVTQEPIAHLFEYGDSILRIIDTPGIGDTRGTEKDKTNFDKIFSFLESYENLHAIVILVKGNYARKTAFFKYCITELMSHFPNDISENIVFCFTHSRDADFGPGDGFTTLRSFLSNEMTEANLTLEPSVNCFFIDNEAYRYLVAKKHGYKYRKAQVAGFEDVWEQSVEQIEQMFDNIVNLQPVSMSHLLIEFYSKKHTLHMSSLRHLLINLERANKLATGHDHKRTSPQKCIIL